MGNSSNVCLVLLVTVVWAAGSARAEAPENLQILECNGDVFWALDFAPDVGGTEGQVIEVDWEGCSWRVLAASFHAFVEDYVDELESGAFRVEDGLPTKEEPDDGYEQ